MNMLHMFDVLTHMCTCEFSHIHLTHTHIIFITIVSSLYFSIVSHSIYVCIYTYIHTHTHTHARARAHARTHARTHARMHARTQAHVRVHSLLMRYSFDWYQY